MMTITSSLLLISWLLHSPVVVAFSPSFSSTTTTTTRRRTFSFSLNANNANKKLSDLPKGISPFEKAHAKALNLGSDFRKKSSQALEQARKDGKRELEIEFPPLLFNGMTQFDDFDNVQELDLNRDWCIEWLPSLSSNTDNVVSNVWFILPDLKECELAKEEWKGGLYREAAQFTTIEAATRHYTKDTEFKKPWGSTMANGVSNLFAGDNGNLFGLLGDSSNLDELEGSPDLHLIWYVRFCYSTS
jgi:hypothetical protein